MLPFATTVDPPEWLTVLAMTTVAVYNMDESHGINHFLNVRRNAIMLGINASLPTSRLMVVADAAYAHDLIDTKYVHDVPEQLERVRSAFLRNGYSASCWITVEKILTTMSFSVRAERLKQGLPAIRIDSDWLLVAIVADADQLDAYDVNRCITFQNRRFDRLPGISTPERIRLIRGWVKTILVNRVLQYRDTYMFTELAKKVAEPLHDQVEKYVRDELADDEIFDYP